MAGIKFEAIRDSEGKIDGYKLGEYYLMKHYYWGNEYEWIINTTGKSFYFQTEFFNELHSGGIELVHSCKQGKQRLVELAGVA